MKTVTFTEFRRNASKLLHLVEKGETVRILRHGRAIAQVVPAEARDVALAWRKPRQRLVLSGESLAKAVLEERRSSP